MNLWEWFLSLFRAASPPPVAQGIYKPGDLVWFLYSPERSGPLPSIEEVVILKQFRVVEALPLPGGIPHSYRIRSGSLVISVHESYLARTPVEAVNGILVEYVE
jgi:hypothetical protein